MSATRQPPLRARLLLVGLLALLGAGACAHVDPLPSWNDGPSKRAILSFVKETTDESGPRFVASAERIAAFDQDGTLWVERPAYTQFMYCLSRVPALVRERPELATVEPFKTVLSGDRAAIAKIPADGLFQIVAATTTGIPVEQFEADVRQWLATARDPRWKRPYTELAYLPMLELLRYLRASGYQTHIVTGGGQDFVRVYAEQLYGVPPEQVVGSAFATAYGHAKDGKPVLTKMPKLLLDSDGPGKPEAIALMIGRRPRAAFGNSTGDREMLEYTKAGDGARLSMTVLHDDARREYAYGPAQGLPEAEAEAAARAFLEEARKQGWFVVSMKDDWRRIFAFEP